MTFICVSIFVDAPLDVPHAIARAADSVEQGARMIEWRLDALAEHPEGLPAILELLEKSPAPCSAIDRCTIFQPSQYMGNGLTIYPSYYSLLIFPNF